MSICSSFTSTSRDGNIQLLQKMVQNHMQRTGRSSHHWSHGLYRSFQHLAQDLQCVDPSTACHGVTGAFRLEWVAISKWCVICSANRSTSQKWRATLSLDMLHEVKVCESLSRGRWDSDEYQIPLPLPAFDSWKAGIVRDHTGKQLLLLCLSHIESHDPLRWTRRNDTKQWLVWPPGKSKGKETLISYSYSSPINYRLQMTKVCWLGLSWLWHMQFKYMAQLGKRRRFTALQAVWHSSSHAA